MVPALSAAHAAPALLGSSADVVVAGAGVAGLSAAVAAARSGQRVVVLEKAAVVGGTARYANGSLWIPNNALARARGIHHDVDQQARFLLSEGHDGFDPAAPWCGVGPRAYGRVARYVRVGHRVLEDLTQTGGHTFTQLDPIFARYFYAERDSVAAVRRAFEQKGLSTAGLDLRMIAQQSWDHRWQNPYNDVPYGKHVWATVDPGVTGRFFLDGLRRHGGPILRHLASIRSLPSLLDQLPKLPGKFWGLGHGLVLIARLRRQLDRLGVPIWTGHALVDLEATGGRVSALTLQDPQGARHTLPVRRALILASGCYAQDPALRAEKHPWPIRSACVSPTNTGDALRALAGHDVQIDWEPGPLLAQGVLQMALETGGVCHEPVFALYGDSFVLVDRHGQRIMNEKLNYQERARHQVGDPERALLFLVCDRRYRERQWGFGLGIPFEARHVLEAADPAALGGAIQAELARLGVGFRLADDFAPTLTRTLARFNTYARQGHDPEFGRGDNVCDVLAHTKAEADHDAPSRTMYPLTGDRLYACIYSLSTFGTQAGLVCDADGRVQRGDGQPWENLYAAGTCTVSLVRGRYPAHGLSLGTGLVLGYVAGLHAAGALHGLLEGG